MLLRRILFAALAVSLMCAAGPVAAQGVLEPGVSSALPSIDTEAPVVQSSTQTSIARPDFRMVGLAMLWSQLAWMPASPMHMPSSLAMVLPGDRRWRLR
jgi:hypothetical protein